MNAVARLTDIAKLLSVSTNQVYMWHDRRHRNGFPEMVAQSIVSRRGGRKRAPLFDLQEVIDWWLDYDPAHQPRPGQRGNQHARKHGRYAGRREKQGASS